MNRDGIEKATGAHVREHPALSFVKVRTIISCPLSLHNSCFQARRETKIVGDYLYPFLPKHHDHPPQDLRPS